ncbi:MAG: Ig domain-containing protein, partial [Acidimicrobiia bacterium]
VQAFNADGSASATDDLPESDAVGKVEWSVTPNLEFEIDGVGGPTFGIATGNAAEYNPTSDGPTWQISDELGGVVGLKAGFFGLIDADIEAPVLTYSQVVRASAPKIDTSSPLPAGTVGTAYSQQLRAKGGPEGPCGSGKQCQYHWSIDPASLAPSWVTITSDGMLHIDAPYGTSPGPVTFTVDVADDASFNNGNPIPISTGHADLTVQLDAAKSGPVSIALPTIPDGVQYLQYQGAALQATSPGAPSFFLWQVAGGALPDGLRLGFFDGTISGTPTVSGDFPVTISATDSNGVVGQVSLTMHVNSDACSAVCAIPLGGSRVAVTWQGCNCAVVSGSFVYHLKEYGNGIWGGRFTNPFYLELLDRDLRTLPDGRVLWTGNVSFMTQPGDSYFVQEALVTVGPAPDYTRGDATATWRTSNTIVIK